MKNLLIGAILIAPLYSSANLEKTEEIDTKIYCMSTDKLFNDLRKNFEESPILFGQTDDVIGSTMSFWVNKGGNTWTIVTSKGDISCVVGVGRNVTFIYKGKMV